MPLSLIPTPPFLPTVNCFKWTLFPIISYYQLVSKKDAMDRGPWSPTRDFREKGKAEPDPQGSAG